MHTSVHRHVLVGPLTPAALRQGRSCVINMAVLPQTQAYIGDDVLMPPLAVQALGSIDSLVWCAEAVEAGTASSILGAEGELQVLLLERGYCGRFTYAPALRGIAYVDLHMVVGAVMQQDAWTVATNLTRAVHQLTRTQAYAANMDAFFLRGRSCPEDEVTDTSDTAALNVHHLSGLFIITYATLGAALLGAVVERALSSRQSSSARASESMHAEDPGSRASAGARGSTRSWSRTSSATHADGTSADGVALVEPSQVKVRASKLGKSLATTEAGGGLMSGPMTEARQQMATQRCIELLELLSAAGGGVHGGAADDVALELIHKSVDPPPNENEPPRPPSSAAHRARQLSPHRRGSRSNVYTRADCAEVEPATAVCAIPGMRTVREL